MKRNGIVFKVLKRVFIGIMAFLIVFFLVRGIGRVINKKTPKGGINESMYIDVNGTKQWINIYGEDLNRQNLLHFH